MSARHTAEFRRHALIPKPRVRQTFVPALPDDYLGSILDRLTPKERQAMRWIVENADMLIVGEETYLIAPVPAKVIDTLAAFEADMEDRENDLEDEKDEGEEDDRDSDNAFDRSATSPCTGSYNDEEDDAPELRAGFAAERRPPPVTWRTEKGEYTDPGRLSYWKAADETRRVRDFIQAARRRAL